MAGLAIRAWRERESVTQMDLADRIGTTNANLSRIESGKQPVSEPLLRKLVVETGLSASTLRPDLGHLFDESKAARRRRAA